MTEKDIQRLLIYGIVLKSTKLLIVIVILTYRLNGNSFASCMLEDVKLPATATPPGSPSASSYRSMGSIIKGSVMDKVTNVFSVGTMGNSINKDTSSATQKATPPQTNEPAPVNTINIPKGKLDNFKQSSKYFLSKKNYVNLIFLCRSSY